MSLDPKSCLLRIVKKNWPFVALLMLALTACSAIQPANTSGTLDAQNSGYVAEATNLGATNAARTTEVYGTAVWSGTYVYTHDQINLKLLATVRANDPPTQQIIAINPTGPVGISGPVTLGAPDDEVLPPTGGAQPTGAFNTVATAPAPAASGGSGPFTNTVTTSAVRASDGCADGSSTTFTTATNRIYVVTQAHDIKAGTQVSVEWKQGDTVVDSKSYNVPSDQSSLCVWFYLGSFTPGDWTVQLSSNNQPIGAAIAFTITAS